MNTNLATNLESFLQEEDTVEIHHSDEFVVDTLEKAVWVDGVARQHEDEIKKIDTIASEKIAQYQAKIDRIKQWQEDQKQSHLNSLEWAKGKLANYLSLSISEQIKKGAKKISKSIKLPFRKIGFTLQQPELTDSINQSKIDKDNAELLKWVKANHPDFVETKETVKWSEFKKFLDINKDTVTVKETGEFLEFIQVVQKEDKFDWKVIE